MKALTSTDFHFPGQKSVYHGKVRDVYDIDGDLLVMIATDRISAFDVILPKGIPFKGQILNQIYNTAPIHRATVISIRRRNVLWSKY